MKFEDISLIGKDAVLVTSAQYLPPPERKPFGEKNVKKPAED